MYSGEVLYDVKSSEGKEITWRQHKLLNLRLAESYKRVDSEKYKRVVNCGGSLGFRRYRNDNAFRLHYANFCQTRLCPMCNWRRSRKVFANISRIMGEIECEYRFVFLTLTCKNVQGDDLSGQIDEMFAAFKALCLRKRFKRAARGWCRVFEITYNWKTREFHPHFHVVLAVDATYFTSDLYITQDEFCVIWQSCLKVNYKPIVDVRSFTESKKDKGKEVAEVAKYTIKSSNIMADLRGVASYNQKIQDEARRITDEMTDQIVITLDSALANRRLIGYGGIFKEKHKELNLDDVDDGDLIRAGDNDARGAADYFIERYHWNVKFRNYLRLEGAETETEEEPREKTNS